MAKEKKRPSKFDPPKRQAAPQAENPVPKNKLSACMARISAAQCAVEDATEIRDTWVREITRLTEEVQEAQRNLADAQGVLVAREEKLRRELDYLREESYKIACNQKQLWGRGELSCAQEEAKVSRNY